MHPPYDVFPPSELSWRTQVIRKDGNDRRRKDPVDLKACELMKMMQYTCQPIKTEPGVECKPYLRFFRRCPDGLTVETTTWEKPKEQGV